MGKQLNKPFAKKLALWSATVLLVAIGLLLLRIYKPEPVTVVEEAAKPERIEPVKLAKSVLRSSLAGRWYSADAGILRSQIEGFFQKADIQPVTNVIGLILPHAGYQYSGQTAAFGLKTSTKNYKRVVVIGPSHRVPMEEVLSVPRVTHYETPLGELPLDVGFIDKLLEYPMFTNVPRAHEYEHSVQIELPLLQYRVGDFKLVPIVAGRCSPGTVERTGSILRGLIDDETLVVASSDFVHYGANYGYIPFRENIPAKIRDLDMGAYKYIEALDAKGFLEYKERTGTTICGCVPVAVLLSMLENPVEVRLANYATSGELTGDFTNSVSYLSVAFSGKWPNQPVVEPQADDSTLSEQDKEQLLSLARRSLVYFLEKRKVPEVSELGVTVSDEMSRARAAFVTLKKNHQLRGCIGDIFPRQPLYKSVIINAISAGVNDRRFVPVTRAECNDITVEVSALTAPEPIGSSEEIRIGVDGVVLNKDGRSAVFLPQVAPEQGWDVNKTLTQLSLKAGLAADAWKEGANFLVFQAEVFGEDR